MEKEQILNKLQKEIISIDYKIEHLQKLKSLNLRQWDKKHMNCKFYKWLKENSNFYCSYKTKYKSSEHYMELQLTKIPQSELNYYLYLSIDLYENKRFSFDTAINNINDKIQYLMKEKNKYELSILNIDMITNEVNKLMYQLKFIKDNCDTLTKEYIVNLVKRY